MRFFRQCCFAVAAALALGFVLGCDRSSAPPTPLPAAEFAAAFDKTFGKAKPEVKELASQLVAAVQAQDYSKAFNGLHALAGRDDLNNAQASLASRALMTVRSLLESAQTQGDQKAAETINHYRSTK
jgi:hypothetical protein